MTKRNVVHIEIPSSDLEQSGKFYHELFGWKVESLPGMNYATWEPEEGPGGGFSPIGEETRVGEILIHIASDDIESDLKKAVSLGGKLLRQKTEIPNIGWWGVFNDPAGNAIALFTSLNPQPAG